MGSTGHEASQCTSTAQGGIEDCSPNTAEVLALHIVGVTPTHENLLRRHICRIRLVQEAKI